MTAFQDPQRLNAANNRAHICEPTFSQQISTNEPTIHRVNSWVTRAKSSSALWQIVLDLDRHSGISPKEVRCVLNEALASFRGNFPSVTDERLSNHTWASKKAAPYLIAGSTAEIQRAFTTFAMEAAKIRDPGNTVTSAVETVVKNTADLDFMTVLRACAVIEDLSAKATALKGLGTSLHALRSPSMKAFRKLSPSAAFRYLSRPDCTIRSSTTFTVHVMVSPSDFDRAKLTSPDITVAAACDPNTPFCFSRGDCAPHLIEHERQHILFNGAAVQTAPMPFHLIRNIAIALRSSYTKALRSQPFDVVFGAIENLLQPFSSNAIIDSCGYEIIPQLKLVLDSVKLSQDESGANVLMCGAELSPLSSIQTILEPIRCQVPQLEAMPLINFIRHANEECARSCAELPALAESIVRLAYRCRALGPRAEQLFLALPLYAAPTQYFQLDVVLGREFGTTANMPNIETMKVLTI